ncbi:succinate dehydrogenase, hydrophobic membrane anchor protein [Actibacterium ureilyticum]|uniref:succinate dehydrogenase, hydrophobic membrane anchor protein n=1 Tax=Actibacterium ureilyticum TaxID=1590614 RepID=UPI000BAAAB87|nr:succinate dehydrogenase, hydrophobic membrane anchor protein [Actibacterium ureilyticum]
MRFLTDRKRAEGLGSSRQGTHHHWQMMVGSIALVLLVPVFIFTFGAGFGGTREEVLAFFARPFPAIVTALTLYVAITHFTREAQEAIEDYVHGATGKLLYVGVNLFSWVLIAAGLFALVKIAL